MIDRIRWVYRAWRYRLKVEPQEIRWILRNLQPGETAVDIGAHKGAYTYWLHRRAGPLGQVFAFEPQPVLAKRLLSLVRGASLDNVRVEQLGLSSRPGSMKLSIPGGGSSPSASFENTEDTRGANLEMPVEVTTLDRYFSATDSAPIRFIKCDAEGHELQVFRGAEQILRRDRPDLMFECEQRHLADHSPRDVFAYLEGLGYRGQAFAANGLVDIEHFDPAIHQAQPGSPAYINNFLFRAQRGADSS